MGLIRARDTLACKGQSTVTVSEVAPEAVPLDWHGPPTQVCRDKVHSFPTLIFHTISAPLARKLHATSQQTSSAPAKHATNPAVALPRKPPDQGKPVALQLALRLTPSERPIMSDYVTFDAQQALDGFVFDPDFDLHLDFDYGDWVDLPLPDFHFLGTSQSGPASALIPHPTPSVAQAQDFAERVSAERSSILPSAVDIALDSRLTEHGGASVKELKCNVPGCNNKTTFSRKYDLRRHATAKHGNATGFLCLASGCFRRGSTRWSFKRLDKLTDHIRLSHDHDTAFMGCLVDDCNFRPCALEVLGIHIQRAHPYHVKPEARAIVNATSAKRRKCPFSGCNNRLYALNDFLTHLGSHSTDDLQAARLNPSLEGIVFGTAPGTVGTGDSFKSATPSASRVRFVMLPSPTLSSSRSTSGVATYFSTRCTVPIISSPGQTLPVSDKFLLAHGKAPFFICVAQELSSAQNARTQSPGNRQDIWNSNIQAC